MDDQDERISLVAELERLNAYLKSPIGRQLVTKALRIAFGTALAVAGYKIGDMADIFDKPLGSLTLNDLTRAFVSFAIAAFVFYLGAIAAFGSYDRNPDSHPLSLPVRPGLHFVIIFVAVALLCGALAWMAL